MELDPTFCRASSSMYRVMIAQIKPTGPVYCKKHCVAIPGRDTRSIMYPQQPCSHVTDQLVESEPVTARKAMCATARPYLRFFLLISAQQGVDCCTLKSLQHTYSAQDDSPCALPAHTAQRDLSHRNAPVQERRADLVFIVRPYSGSNMGTRLALEVPCNDIYAVPGMLMGCRAHYGTWLLHLFHCC